MNAVETIVEVNPDMTFLDLWIEAKSLCPKLPAKSQFYEWLKAAWIHESQKRGGVKTRRIYTQTDLNRIVTLYQLMKTHGSLKAAQSALLSELKTNPTFYGA